MNDNLFKNGITGFNSPVMINKHDIIGFAKTLYYPFVPNSDKIRRENNYWIIPIELTATKEKIEVLVNCSYWIFASRVTTSTNVLDTTFDFINTPFELQQLIQSNMTDSIFLSPQTLGESIQNYDLYLLNKHEVTQIKYWQPKTVAEVIFNQFD